MTMIQKWVVSILLCHKILSNIKDRSKPLIKRSFSINKRITKQIVECKTKDQGQIKNQ
jgi:hypothetical protein